MGGTVTEGSPTHFLESYLDPKPEELVHVVITEKPQRVWVVFRDKIHHGSWGTVNPGECGIRSVESGSNLSLLNAAMYAWSGQSHFTVTYGDLVESSGGWGVQWG